MNILTRLRKASEAVAARPELIRQAREEGYAWEQIAAAANMSRAGVIKASKIK